MKDTQPILIISTGRTGTIFLARLFASLYPELAESYHERGNSRPIQILTNLHLAHLLPLGGLKGAWRVLKGWEIEQCKKAFHIDANCFLYGLAALAPDLYPGLKVVHIVRDPRTYVTSHLNFAEQKGTSYLANHWVPFWQPSPVLSGGGRGVGMTRFEKYCWIWDFKNGVMQGLEGSDTPYLRVRFEDLFNSGDPEKVFGEMTDFVGLPRAAGIRDKFREPANTSAKTDFPEWPAWTAEQARQLDTLCGRRMARYGYGGEPDWALKLHRMEV